MTRGLKMESWSSDCKGVISSCPSVYRKWGIKNPLKGLFETYLVS